MLTRKLDVTDYEIHVLLKYYVNLNTFAYADKISVLTALVLDMKEEEKRNSTNFEREREKQWRENIVHENASLREELEALKAKLEEK